MSHLGIPQERITQSFGISQQVISHHLQKMLTWANLVNTELKKGFTAAQVAEKHAWAEPLVWSIALEGRDDFLRFKALNWGLRTFSRQANSEFVTVDVNQAIEDCLLMVSGQLWD